MSILDKKNYKLECFKKKSSNFFNNNKFSIIILGLFIAFIIVIVINFFNRPKYDITILMSGNYNFLTQYDDIKSNLEKHYIEDYNGDNKVNLELVTFKIQNQEGLENPQPNVLNLSNLMVNLSNSSTVIYIIDENVYNSIGTEEAFENLEMDYENIQNIKDDKYYIENTKFLENLGINDLPKDFFISIRNIKEIEENPSDKIQQDYENSKNLLNKIILDDIK